MNKSIFKSLILSLVVVFVLSGCKKYKDNRETISCEDYALGDATFSDIFHLVNRVVSESDSALDTFSPLVADSCLTVTVSKTNGGFPKTYTLNFGETDCPGAYDVVRNGILTIVFDKSFYVKGARATITSNGFSTGGYEVKDGGATITNSGINSSGNQEFSMSVRNGEIQGGELVVSWETDRAYEIVDDGGNEWFVWDDTYKVRGAAKGVNREGREFEAEILSDLTKEVVCRWPRSGIVGVFPNELKKQAIDFGDENCVKDSGSCCDNDATVTINDKKKEHPVKLR